MDGFVLIRFYLQKQVLGCICLLGHSLAPDSENGDLYAVFGFFFFEIQLTNIESRFFVCLFLNKVHYSFHSIPAASLLPTVSLGTMRLYDCWAISRNDGLRL